MKLFIESARLGEDGFPKDKDIIRFSFGTAFIGEEELAWVNEVSKRKGGKKDKPSFKTITLNQGTVIGWELAKNNLKLVMTSALKKWDVEETALSNEQELCTVQCREAEGFDCECVCGGSNHGGGHGLNPMEVIQGDLIIGNDYQKVIRRYAKGSRIKKVQPRNEGKGTEQLSWSALIAASPEYSEPDPKDPDDYCETVFENGNCCCGECF